MLEKKKIFVDSFNKKAEDLIKQSDEKIAQYAAARQKAIKLTDPISLSFSDPKVSFSTVGELFAWVYPEAGGSENMPSAFTSVILENLAGKDSPGKAEYKTFAEYLETEGLNKCLPGMPNLEHGLSVYFKYYTKEEESEFGVIAIRIELI